MRSDLFDAPGRSSGGPLRRRELFTLTALAAGVPATAANAAARVPSPAPPPVWTAVEIPPQAPAAEGMLDVGGTRLWYWDTGGSGEPVIFLHAGSQSGAGWGYQQPVFAAAGFRAIGYSRRGCYRSDPGNPSDPGYAAEDLNKLLAHLKLERVHLVALALGAFYALDFALLHPHKVRSLTITSSFLGIDVSEKDYAEANARLRPKEFEALPVAVKELHPSYRVGNPAGLASWMKLASEATPGPRVTPKRPHKLTWALLESIKLPTLLMTGDGDLYTPPALLRMQASHMPHAEVVVIQEAGHCANWEQPEAFNRTVISFLRRHAG
jgi:pimeloyl-ACP methyl ester carboxylesterase